MTPPLWQTVKRNQKASWWKWKWRVKKLAKSSAFRKGRSWHLVPSLHGKQMGKQWLTILLGSKITADGDCSHEIKGCLLFGRKVMTTPDSILKSRDITLPTKVHLVKVMVFSSSHIRMWELDYKERWLPKNWCFWTVVLEKTLESPLACKEMKPVHSKRDQSWVFIGRTDIKAETPILWPLDVTNWLIWKDPDAGKYWRLKEKGMTEDEMVRWHHRLNGYEF